MDIQIKQRIHDHTVQLEEFSLEDVKTFISDLQARQGELERQNAELQQQLERIASHEARYKQLFENMRSGVALYEAVEDGQDFIFRDFNRAGERIEHFKKEELVGKSVLKIFPGVRDFGLYVLKSFRDISERKRMEEARLRELQSLQQLSSPQQIFVTAGIIGADPLHKSAPHLFAEFVERQEALLDLALQEQVYKTDQHVADKLRTFAEQLGFLKASPRDVVDIHIKALQQKAEKVSPRKNEAYTDVGRLMLLELMGYLVSYYRNYYIGVR